MEAAPRRACKRDATPRPQLTNTCLRSENSIDLAQAKQLRFDPMTWILNPIRRLTAVLSQQSPSGHERLTRPGPQQADSVQNSQPSASSSQHTEATFYAKGKELAVENSLKDIPGVTDQMLAAFGEHGVTSIEDLAACATDDLDGWSESKDGKTIRHTGILDCLGISREDCEVIIINARIKAGWISS
jgi:predicted flap endonuclease-1-like 5' DNA nuclease